MLDVFPRQVRRSVLAALLGALVPVGCGNDTSNHGSTSPGTSQGGGGAGSGGSATTTGGTPSGTGGASLGAGGTPLASGGATSTPGSGGSTAATGGVATAVGGAPPGTGGMTIATGGSTSGAGGGASGAGGGRADASADTGPARNDGGPDLPADLAAARDSAPDAGSATNDVPGADTASPSTDAPGIPVPDGYKLVWSDEFNVDGAPDPKNWNYEKGFVRNNELQWYQPQNATIKGGLLVIEARKEQVMNPNYQAGSSDWKTSRQYADYTSTSMTTSGLQTWQYGRFEMRAKIPTSAGMWPAWWTLGVSGEWPSNGEIDIMEYYAGNVLANVACGTATRWTAKWDGSSKAISSLGANWASSFHIWRMDWDDQQIALYLDDALMNSATLSSMLNADGTSPFKQKVYMILNLAIGGDHGGDPSGTPFPQPYQIDYVRVFQKL